MDERWSEQKRQRDQDDLNNEAAGRDVGRIKRFRPDQSPEFLDKKKRENEERISQLMQMMRDPVYAAAYQGAWDSYHRAQEALDQALLDNAEEIERLEALITEYEENALRMPDGTLAFLAADGSLRSAEGHLLRGEAVPASPSNTLQTTSYAQYAEGRAALQSARVIGQELADIQTEVLDPANARLSDNDNPLSLDELDGVVERMDRLTNDLYEGRIPEIDANEVSSVEPGHQTSPIATPIGLPSLD